MDSFSFQHRSDILIDIRKNVDEVFEEMVFRKWSVSRRQPWEPPIDLYDTPDGYVVELDVPAVVPEDLRVTVEEHRLTVTGSRPVSPPDASIVCRQERRGGEFCKSLDLPEAVNPEHVEIRFHHGTCRIFLPKKTDRERSG